MADDLAVVRSMTSKVNEHAQGNYAFHSGFPFMGHPSAGAWVSYGLGSANENLPSFVVLNSAGSVAPHGGVGLYGSGYLPAAHQGSILQVDKPEPVRNVKPRESLMAQRSRLGLINGFDQDFLAQTGQNIQVEAAIKNYETAYRMQSAVPELCDLDGESEATKKLYGFDQKETRTFGQQLLAARRFVERGVRFIQIMHGDGAAGAWDQHSNLKSGHTKLAMQVDRPIAGLLKDLKSRGLLDETLVVFATEFGRTPGSQGSNGRDHHPYAFSIWMAGGGIKGGVTHGATDDIGFHPTENPHYVTDAHATILHQLGLDPHAMEVPGHKRLEQDFGKPIKEIIA
jgi:hypothetical protein